MIETNLVITLQKDDGNYPVIRIQGNLDHSAKTSLWPNFEKAGSSQVVGLDFSGLEKLDGAGASLLVLLVSRAISEKRYIKACGVSDPLRKVFKLLSLDEAMEYCTTLHQPTDKITLPVTENVPVFGWAVPVERLHGKNLPLKACKINLENRRAVSPLNGFGQLFRKTYRIKLTGAGLNAEQILETWKEEFPSFWSKGNYFYGPPGSLEPGMAAALHLTGPGGMNYPGGLPMIATGLLVIHVLDQSFSFLTAEGHILAGMITFSVFTEMEDIFAQVQAVGRASDPLFELMFRIGLAHKLEDTFWLQTLRNLAARFGLTENPVLQIEYFDKKVNWSKTENLWQNAAIRSGIYWVLTPVRWLIGSKS